MGHLIERKGGNRICLGQCRGVLDDVWTFLGTREFFDSRNMKGHLLRCRESDSVFYCVGNGLMTKTSKELSPMTLLGTAVKGEDRAAMKEGNCRGHLSLTTSSEILLPGL